jgi:hypothetical protein
MRAHHRRTRRLSTADLALIRQAISRNGGTGASIPSLHTPSIVAEVSRSYEAIGEEQIIFQAENMEIAEIADIQHPCPTPLLSETVDRPPQRGLSRWLTGIVVATSLLGSALVIQRIFFRGGGLRHRS